MDWTHLKPDDGRRMPWKNGGGSTLEIAVEPPGATLEAGFLWRVSSADVGVSGPFSLFPGLERWLLLLEGLGFEIDFGTRGRAELTEPLQPLRFSGDWPAVATLMDGPCRDFNLMLDPRFCRARLAVVHSEVPRLLALSASTTLLFVAKGTLGVPLWGLHLGQRHTLRVDDGEGALHLVPGYGGVSVVVVEIQKV